MSCGAETGEDAVAVASAGGQMSGRMIVPKLERLMMGPILRLALALAGAAAMFVTPMFGIARSASASAQDGAAVALAYDSEADALLKATVDAVYQSDDSGRSWRRLPTPSLGEGRITGLATSPAGKGVIYLGGSNFGVLRSGDDGKTWVERDDGLPNHDVVAVAAHATQSDTVYAVVREHGIYRSQDSGKTWRLMDRGPREGISQLIHSNMAGSMQTGWLFAATPKGVRRIMDCFCLWQNAGKLDSQILSVTYDPKQPEHLAAATENGLLRSVDGGESWTRMTPIKSKAVAVFFAPGGVLFAIDADGNLFRSADQGETWAQANA
jgi:photosystem II stability/assembly factor-like uncharacterized protein